MKKISQRRIVRDMTFSCRSGCMEGRRPMNGTSEWIKTPECELLFVPKGCPGWMPGWKWIFDTVRRIVIQITGVKLCVPNSRG